MPLKIREWIGQKRLELEEKRIESKGLQLQQKAKEAEAARRYNALAKTEAKLDAEIALARDNQRKNSAAGKFISRLNATKERMDKFKKKRLKRVESKKNKVYGAGFGGSGFGSSGFGRDPFG